MARRSFCTLFALVLGLVAMLGSVPANANPFIPDNLDGPCCQPTVANIPNLPTTSLQTKYVCWNNCNVGLSGTVLTTFDPAPVACGIYLTSVSVTNLPGTLAAWSGRLVMTYSRTWAESSVPGAAPDTQVWRFILNGDMRPSAALIAGFAGNTCIVQPCINPYGRFHVAGYIDYALDCNTNTFSVAFAFDHDCDAFEHGTAFSCRPGVFHPGRSYTWVGPAAGFVCDTNIPTAQGPINCEAFRNNDFNMPLAQICQFEQPIVGGGIGNQGEFCPCNVAAGTQYKVQQFDAATVCMSVANSTSVAAWPGLVGKSIGTWTDPMVYPGRESLHIERGHASYTDGCTNTQSRPYFIGVQTQGGFTTSKIVVVAGGGISLVPVSDRLIDLGNATLPNLNAAPQIGKLSISDRLIYFNVDP